MYLPGSLKSVLGQQNRYSRLLSTASQLVIYGVCAASSCELVLVVQLFVSRLALANEMPTMHIVLDKLDKGFSLCTTEVYC